MNLQVKRAKELCVYLVQEVKKDGIVPTFKRGTAFLRRRTGKKRGRFLPFKSALEYQSAHYNKAWPVISICVPIYNTPKNYLQEMINSVKAQTCPLWELCLADASDSDECCKVISEYKDTRIKYVKIENIGISANTNEAAKRATGEYLALLDHDDILSPNAVYEMSKAAYEQQSGFIYSDEALFATDMTRPIVGHFKPDFAPDYLNCCNYICHFAAFKRDLFWQVGGENPLCDGSQDHDLFLKLSEIEPPYHIPKVLYYWRVHEGSTSAGTAAKPYVANAAKAAINAHLSRIGAKGNAVDGLFPSTYKVEYAMDNEPLVSILIPNKDHIEELEKALYSITQKTSYKNYEIIIIENNSSQSETFAYYDALPLKYPMCRVVKYEGGFNFSAINNFGARAAKGEYLLLLNNDVEVINGEWLFEMLSISMQKGVGIVGAKLIYQDGSVQHAGVITGLGGFAGHSHKYARGDGGGYMFRLGTVQDFSAVTAACLMIKKEIYSEVNGLDEGFAVAFNDVDFCLRVLGLGYRVVYTPYARLYHYESKSRGQDTKGEAKLRFEKERERLAARYGKSLLHDRFYNPNLTLDREDFSENDVLPRDV
ncbi:MAG: glycosyltransferase family 2 protein [Oscillospiraceae bacterium]